MSRRAGSIAAAALASLALASCGGGEDDKQPERAADPGGPLEVVIGNSVPLSGELEDFGPSAEKAAGLAIDRIEEAIVKSDSRSSVKLLTEDNATDAEKATATAQKMAEEGAGCIVGPWAAADVVSAGRSVAIPENVLLISPAATLDEITNLEDRGLINRTVPPDSDQGPVVAGAIADDLGGAKGKVVDVAARADGYGEGLANSFELSWEERGGEIGTKALYEPDTSNFEGVAERFEGSDADALVAIDFPAGFEGLVTALDRSGSYDPESTWGTDLLASTELGDDLGPDLLDGVRLTSPGVPDSGAATAFAKEFGDADPDDVEAKPYAAQTFDAVVLCFLASVAAESTAGDDAAASLGAVSAPGGERFTWEQLPGALEALEEGEEIDYEGASGAIDLNQAGDPTAASYDVYSFDAGRLVLEGKRPLAAGDSGS